LWLCVHILFLVEIRRRVEVLFEWAWAYVTWHRGSRLIVDAPHEYSQLFGGAAGAAGSSTTSSTTKRIEAARAKNDVSRIPDNVAASGGGLPASTGRPRTPKSA
jgi:hypothetical protein